MVNVASVFMFPGQGSQSVGMGRDLWDEFVEFKETILEASDTLGFDMAKLCFEDTNKELSLTEFTQPAILAVSTGVFRVLAKRTGVKAALVAGHSLGEYSALVALGALEFRDALKAVRFRGQAMQRAVPVGVGAMAAYVGAKCDEVVAICKEENRAGDVVEIVNFNSASQMVLSGHKTAVERASARIAAAKLGRAIALPVSAPFHSSLMEPAAKEMGAYLEKVELRPFEGKIVANVDARAYASGGYSKMHLVRQLASAVLWTQSLETLRTESGEGARYIEVGPGTVLQGLLKKTFAGAEPLGTESGVALKNVLTVLGS